MSLLARDLFNGTAGTIITGHIPDLGFGMWILDADASLPPFLLDGSGGVVYVDNGNTPGYCISRDNVFGTNPSAIFKIKQTNPSDPDPVVEFRCVMFAEDDFLTTGDEAINILVFPLGDGTVAIEWRDVHTGDNGIIAAAASWPINTTLVLRINTHGNTYYVYQAIDNSAYTFLGSFTPNSNYIAADHAHWGFTYDSITDNGKYQFTQIDVNSNPDATKELQLGIQPVEKLPDESNSCQIALYKFPENVVDTSYVGSVTIALGSNPAGGTLSGTLTHPCVAGVVTFSGISIDKAGTYTIVATDDQGRTAESFPFVVTAPEYDLTFTVQPSTVTTIGDDINTPHIKVTVSPGGGDWDGCDVVLAIVAGDNPNGAALVGTVNATIAADVAEFTSPIGTDKGILSFSLEASVDCGSGPEHNVEKKQSTHIDSGTSELNTAIINYESQALALNTAVVNYESLEASSGYTPESIGNTPSYTRTTPVEPVFS